VAPRRQGVAVAQGELGLPGRLGYAFGTMLQMLKYSLAQKFNSGGLPRCFRFKNKSLAQKLEGYSIHLAYAPKSVKEQKLSCKCFETKRQTPLNMHFSKQRSIQFLESVSVHSLTRHQGLLVENQSMELIKPVSVCIDAQGVYSLLKCEIQAIMEFRMCAYMQLQVH